MHYDQFEKPGMKLRDIVLFSVLFSIFTSPAFAKNKKEKDKPLPLLVVLHGGPTAASLYRRQFWIYGRTLFASKGWAVFMPNYRGSTGYGRNFMTALIGRSHSRSATASTSRTSRSRSLTFATECSPRERSASASCMLQHCSRSLNR